LSDTDNKLYAVKDGVVVIKKGAILPDGFTIGQ
jgi:glucose-1-phosphate adenylyltransferase